VFVVGGGGWWEGGGRNFFGNHERTNHKKCNNIRGCIPIFPSQIIKFIW
jgi:hypothetical protein